MNSVSYLHRCTTTSRRCFRSAASTSNGVVAGILILNLLRVSASTSILAFTTIQQPPRKVLVPVHVNFQQRSQKSILSWNKQRTNHVNNKIISSQRYHPQHNWLVLSSSSSTLQSNDVEENIQNGSSSTTASSTNSTTTPTSIVNGSTSTNTTVIMKTTESLWNNIQQKIGAVSYDRIYHPELASGDVPRLFSHLQYGEATTSDSSTSNTNTTTTATTTKMKKRVALHAAGSTLGAAALIAGTTVGAGVLALPAATVSSGFIPSTMGLCFNWAYMTISGLLLAELSINRMAETGKPGLGILDLYRTYLGEDTTTTTTTTTKKKGEATMTTTTTTTNSTLLLLSSSPKQLLPLLANVAYFFLHYAMMVAYISQGGQNLVNMFMEGGASSTSTNVVVLSQILFATVSALTLYVLSNFPVWIQNFNNVLVLGVVASFLGLISIGAPTVNIPELLNPIHQHPENVLSAFPIMVLSLVFQNVVPTVVTQLECDRQKVTQAIVGGTLVPLLMFLLWNGVILGNMYNSDLTDVATTTNLDPISILQVAATNGNSNLGMLTNLVQIFSELAIITSLIGFVYGLIGAWTDILKLPTTSGVQHDQQLWKPLLFGAVFLPPLALVVLSNGNPDIFIQALDYGGAFGVSTLFLLLPPFMVWKSRYSDTDERKLATLPLMPGGKLALGSLWKAAGTLIIEQGLDKLGVLSWFHDTFLK